jgi:ACS family hexuronate transporter-like MFS transporter
VSDAGARSGRWRWYVCGLLLLATTINYIDRQTLASTARRIIDEFHLSAGQYGDLESGFAFAFAFGSITFGVLADRVNVRWLYPIVLIGWSAVGFATGLQRSHGGLLVCRTLLGLFEAGHWPCALKAVQRILDRRERPFGNSLLQSGSSVGAIAAPLLVQHMLDAGYAWRTPFLLVGAVGAGWTVLWLSVVRTADLAPAPGAVEAAPGVREGRFRDVLLSPRFAACAVMVAAVNVCWQLLRAWLPLFLQQGRGYAERDANHFSSLYYVATDLGALSTGFVALRLAKRGMSVHAARCWVFLGAALCALMTTAAAMLPRGPALLGVLLVVGFGALGVAPCYYAFAQELTVVHQGKANGVLGVCAWVMVALVQRGFGRFIDAHKSYDLGIALAGWAPLASLLVLLALWNRKRAYAA